MGETVVAAVEKKQLTEAEKAFSKIENPQTIKDFFVNNLLTTVDKIDKEYNGTVEQQSRLSQALMTQALHSKTNNGFAFLDNTFSNALQVNLEERNLPALKANRDMLVNELLPAIHNIPTDPKVLAEFKAIMTAALGDSIREKAAQMGIVNTAKQSVKPKEVEKLAAQGSAVEVPAK